MVKQDISIEGEYARLRLANASDAQWLYDLRTKYVDTSLIHPMSTYENHLRWLDSYFQNDDDYHFVVENKTNGEPVGTIALYKIEFAKKRAFMGRWVMLPKNTCAYEAVNLIYKVAFEIFDLETILMSVNSKNKNVASFHKFYGVVNYPEKHDYFIEEPTGYNFMFLKENYPKAKLRILSLQEGMV